MRPANLLQRIICAGCICLALLLGNSSAAGAEDFGHQLQHADSIKTSDHPEFTRSIKELSSNAARFSAAEQLYFRYLIAWELVYSGDYTAAIPQLNAVIAS